MIGTEVLLIRRHPNHKVLSGRLQELRLQRSCQTESPDALDLLHELAKSYESADPRQWLFSVGKRGPRDLLSHLRSSLVGCNEVQSEVEVRL